MNNNEFENDNNFVKVRFTTGSTTNRIAPSPTRKIQGGYHYGKDGDIIFVHVDDQKARPDIYKLIDEKPKTVRRKRRTKKEAA